MNELSSLCEIAGADIDQVRIGIGTDSRIGMSFLFPGIGYGGSCFPKDVQALMKTGRDFGLELKISTSVEEANAAQKRVMVNKILKHYGSKLTGKTFAVWGLAFKPRTDDVREAPALVVCSELIKNGAKIRAFDPEANGTFQESFRNGGDSITYLDNNYEALKGCDALIVCTEWNEFRTPNFDRIKKELKAPIIFDGRNIYKPNDMLEHGFTYYSIGRRVVGKA
jgi:UDPglucose 6-dehydrogenase